MKASFGASVSGLKKTKNVWFEDASYRDVSGTMLFTQKETAMITRHLSRAGKVFQKINSRSLQSFLDVQKTLEGGSAAGASFKTYNNTLVRAGEKVKDSRTHTRGYSKYFEEWWKAKQIGSVKQEKTKKQKEKLMKEYLRVFRQTESTVRQVVDELPEDRGLDFWTVQTYLRRLAQKGYLKSRKDGRSNVYSAAVDPKRVVREVFDETVERLFDGEAIPAFQLLIQDRRLTIEEIDYLQAELEELKSQRQKKRR